MGALGVSLCSSLLELTPASSSTDPGILLGDFLFSLTFVKAGRVCLDFVGLLLAVMLMSGCGGCMIIRGKVLRCSS